MPGEYDPDLLAGIAHSHLSECLRSRFTRVVGRDRSSAVSKVPRDTDLSETDVLHRETRVRGENRRTRNLHLGPGYVLCSLPLLGMAVSSMILANVYSAITPESDWRSGS